MTAKEFMAGAAVEELGDAWGDPLWRFTNDQASLSVDVHGKTEDEARKVALKALPALLGEPT